MDAMFSGVSPKVLWLFILRISKGGLLTSKGVSMGDVAM